MSGSFSVAGAVLSAGLQRQRVAAGHSDAYDQREEKDVAGVELVKS